MPSEESAVRTDTTPAHVAAHLAAWLAAVGMVTAPAAGWAQSPYLPTGPLPPQVSGAPPMPQRPATQPRVPQASMTPPSMAPSSMVPPSMPQPSIAQTPLPQATPGPAAGPAALPAQVTPAVAEATTGPAPGPAPDTAQPVVSPPGRVGRVGRIAGTVSFHATDAAQWTPATLNFPVASGNGFWTEPDGQAEIDLGASQLDLAGETELDFDTLDSTRVIATAAQGEIYLDLSKLAQGEAWTVVTPRGTILLDANGRYGIAAGDTEHPTVVTVIAGAATVTGTNISLQVPAGQAAVIDGADTYAGHLQPAAPDAFLQAMVARDTPPPDPGIALPPQVAQMPGCTQLASYGTWRTSPEYGQIWYPTVTAGWAPYRDGHWAYVAPWGWTWIDDEPWGFAPFHYGRWMQVDGAWGWIPGDYVAGVEFVPEPVYAPALVTFVSADGAALAGAAIAGLAAGAFAAGAIGWLPLGWHEPYYPWFHAGPGWVRGVNFGYVTNVGAVVNNYVGGRFYGGAAFINRAGATMVPPAAMFASRSIAGIGRPIPGAAFGHFRPVVGREPLRPTALTQGLPTGAAGRLGIGRGAGPGAGPGGGAGAGPGAGPLRASGPAFAPRGTGFASRGGGVPLHTAGGRTGFGGGFAAHGPGGYRGGGYSAQHAGYGGAYRAHAGGWSHGGFHGGGSGLGGPARSYGGFHGGGHVGGAPHAGGGGHFAGGGGHGRG